MEVVVEGLIRRVFLGGVEVRGMVEMEIKSLEIFLMVYVEVGEFLYLFFMVYICYLKLGVNDNVSGNVMFFELVRVLLKRENGRFGYVFFWVFEYYGS